MADTLSKPERSRVMALIQSTRNKTTEEMLATLLKNKGIRGWRRSRRLFGKPDFIFWEQRLALFVDGCYWHGCPDHCRMPKSNSDYWRRKIASNKKRDLIVVHVLRKAGWRVLRIWEHDLRNTDRCAKRILKSLKLAKLTRVNQTRA